MIMWNCMGFHCAGFHFLKEINRMSCDYRSMLDQTNMMNAKPTIALWNCCLLLLGMVSSLQGQDYEWDIFKSDENTQQKIQNRDSLLSHMKNKWEIKVSYGQWSFSGRVKSQEEELFFFDQGTGLWRFSGGWHVSERLSAEVGVGVQIQQNLPATPNVGSILAGDDFELEGSGGAFIPLDLTVKYYFTQKRWRPYVGIGGGAVLGNALYTLAEGNLADGVTRSDFETNGNAWLQKLETGIDYRLGLHTSASLNATILTSSKFQETLGGYTAYEGIFVNAGFSIVF